MTHRHQICWYAKCFQQNINFCGQLNQEPLKQRCPLTNHRVILTGHHASGSQHFKARVIEPISKNRKFKQAYRWQLTEHRVSHVWQMLAIYHLNYLNTQTSSLCYKQWSISLNWAHKYHITSDPRLTLASPLSWCNFFMTMLMHIVKSDGPSNLQRQ